MAEAAVGKVIGTHKSLTDFDRSLLWVLTSYLKFGGFIHVKQADLANDMDTRPSQISRSVRRLLEAGVIERHGTSKYKLSPSVGMMGSRRKNRVAAAADRGIKAVKP